MPVFNEEKYLPQTLDSLRAQTMRDYELICVDDGSTDHSLEILQSYSAKDNRIRIVHQDRKGAGTARNLGFQTAIGKYTIFLDSDDLFAPELLERSYSRAEETGADITAFQFCRLYEDGHRENRTGVHLEWLSKDTREFNYCQCPDRIMSVVNPTPWNKLYRSQFIRERNLRFEEISSTNDITFAAVSVAMAEKVACLDEHLVFYRVGHSGTITSSKPTKLHNVKTAVVSAVEQVQALPYYQSIIKAVRFFAVDNFRFAFDSYVTDLTDENAADFYRFLHDFFNGPLFPESGTAIENDIYLNNLYTAVKRLPLEDYLEQSREPVTVSLTSYPARIRFVPRALDSIWKQSHLPDQVVLWLAEEQFPNGEADLPDELKSLIQRGQLQLRWCDDLMPHKKYFYMLQECRAGVVITIDDDLCYPTDMIRRLMMAHLAYPGTVAAMRTHVMAIEQDGSLLPYRLWLKETTAGLETPSFQLLATGGAGALYPANLFTAEVFDREAVLNNCLRADDLWMKAMELICDVPVVPAADHMDLCYVPDSQEEALWHGNIEQDGNDIQFERIIQWVDERYGEGFFTNRIGQPLYGQLLVGMQYYAAWSTMLLEQYRDKLGTAFWQEGELRREKVELEKVNRWQKKELQRVLHSRSYRLGRILSFPIRKMKELLRRRKR